MFRAPSSANNDILGPTDPAIRFYMAVPESPMRLFTIESHYQLLKHSTRYGASASHSFTPTPENWLFFPDAVNNNRIDVVATVAKPTSAGLSVTATGYWVLFSTAGHDPELLRYSIRQLEGGATPILEPAG